MIKFGKGVVKHRVLILIIAVALMVPSVFGILKTRINYDMLTYLPDDIETMKGQNILLDDFGSGYTSYDDLQNLAIDILKIDKRITKNAHTEKGLAILKNIVKTASDLGIKTICEGIETAEEEKIAISAGCDMLQGYYYYHPMPVTKLEQLLQNESKKNKAAGDE